MPATALFTPAPTSLYIHLPFCVQKCAYCAFPVVVSSSPAAHKSYIDVLTREIAAFFAKRAAPPPLRTLYLGGGTPSLLHPSLLETLLDSLRALVPFHNDIEFTAEMDPATFDLTKAQRFASLGVNRASIGAQSFDDTLLAMCRRIHNSRQIHSALHTVRHAGIPKVSLDLISGLPTQTRASWRRSLHQALSLQPDHISTYDLTLEPGTPFHARYTEGITPLPDENDASAMMSDAAEILSKRGYEHYEISNFAKRSTQTTTNRSQHNMAYWNNRPFYAFGLGATSLVDGFRFARPRTLRDYTRYVQDLETNVCESSNNHPQRLHAALYPHMTPQTDREILEDFLINSFRMLVDGVSMRKLEAHFGSVVRQRLQSAILTHAYLQDEGLVDVVVSTDGRVELIRLTEKGACVENSILSCLMQDAIWCFPEEDRVVS